MQEKYSIAISSRIENTAVGCQPKAESLFRIRWRGFQPRLVQNAKGSLIQSPLKTTQSR